MPPAKSKSGDKTSNFWHPVGEGREETQSVAIIHDCLARLQNKRVLLTLLHRGYESGGTILIGHNRQQLEIDRPADWPGTSNRVRILFKDSGKLWNYFTVDIIGTTGDSIVSRPPRSLYRLQRRAHFRVEAPRGGTAGFIHRETAYANLSILDLSIGGMQLCSKTRLALFQEDKITAISLSLPGGNALLKKKGPQDLVLTIRQARVARTIEGDGLFCYGIAFDHSLDEEKHLLRYVRQRELELLRKGLRDEQQPSKERPWLR